MGRFDTLGSLISAHRVGRPPPPWRVRERRPPMGGRRASPPGVWPFYWCFITKSSSSLYGKGNNVGMLLSLATECLNSQKLKLMRSCKVNKQYFYQHLLGCWTGKKLTVFYINSFAMDLSTPRWYVKFIFICTISVLQKGVQHWNIHYICWTSDIFQNPVWNRGDPVQLKLCTDSVKSPSQSEFNLLKK